tara:strand:- start:77 stop:712 length:636 start_codon:yes stop_codon:yes gene_type:complete
MKIFKYIFFISISFISANSLHAKEMFTLYGGPGVMTYANPHDGSGNSSLFYNDPEDDSFTIGFGAYSADEWQNDSRIRGGFAFEYNTEAYADLGGSQVGRTAISSFGASGDLFFDKKFSNDVYGILGGGLGYNYADLTTDYAGSTIGTRSGYYLSYAIQFGLGFISDDKSEWSVTYRIRNSWDQVCGPAGGSYSSDCFDPSLGSIIFAASF